MLIRTLKDAFKKQLEQTPPLTNEQVAKLHEPNYYNGQPKQIGDIILFAFLDENQNQTTLITLNERHFDMFQVAIGFEGSGMIPTIMLK